LIDEAAQDYKPVLTKRRSKLLEHIVMIPSDYKEEDFKPGAAKRQRKLRKAIK
jgi:hypothetical protein